MRFTPLFRGCRKLCSLIIMTDTVSVANLKLYTVMIHLVKKMITMEVRTLLSQANASCRTGVVHPGGGGICIYLASMTLIRPNAKRPYQCDVGLLH